MNRDELLEALLVERFALVDRRVQRRTEPGAAWDDSAVTTARRRREIDVIGPEMWSRNGNNEDQTNEGS